MKTYVHKKTGAKIRISSTLTSPEWKEVTRKPAKKEDEKKGG